MRRALTLPAILLVFAVIPYLPTLWFGFVYDDIPFIVRNHRLETATIGEILLDRTTIAGAESYPGTYRPLRTFAFALDTRLAGKAPWFFHAANVFLHALATLLLFVLLRRLLRTEDAAFYACILFAIHPAAIEAVAWCSSRDNGLMLVFFLGALILHRASRERSLLGIGAVVCFALSLLAKEMAATFPAIVLLHDRSDRERAPLGRRRLVLYAAYAATLIGYLALRAHVLGDQAMQRHEPWGGSWTTSILSGVTACGEALERCFIPVSPRVFTFDYQLPLTTSPLHFWFLWSVGMLSCFVFLGVIGLVKRLPLALFFLWFPITILPVANVIYPINILFADRFLYLPAIGPIVLVSVLFTHRPERQSRTLRVLRVAMPLLFGVAFALVLPAWRNSETLWSRAVASFPENPRALTGLAAARRDEGALESARELLAHARRSEPTYWQAYQDGIAVAALSHDDGDAWRIASEWVNAAIGNRPAESAEIAEKCVPVLRTLVEKGRAKEALSLGRLLERAGTTSRDFACLYAVTLEASDLADEAKPWRRRCDVGR